MKRTLLVLGLLAASLAAAQAHARGMDHNPVKAADPVGDSNGAPDITGVTVANDLSGAILFVVEVANRTGFAASDDVLIYIDSDRSALTGYPDRGGGADYLLGIDAATQRPELARWNGTGFEPAAGTTLRLTWANGYVARINRAELGATGDFGFFVRTRLKGGAASQFDVAPTDGYGAYTLGPPHIEAIGARFTPAAPRAGPRFRLNSVQLEFETAERAAAATFACRATLAARRIRGSGRGGCTFKLPKSAKGKRFAITISAAAAGGKAETFGPYSFRVR
jgi:hypothetical protein